MKREICCPTCAEAWKRIGKNPEVAASGETVRVIEGESLATGLRCDGCDAPINHGDPAAAVSVIGPGMRDMPGWEAAYVMPPKGAPAPQEADDTINIEGLDRAAVLVALYHGTRSIGMGRLHDNPAFGLDEAKEHLDHAEKFAQGGRIYFDWVSGRPIKVQLTPTHVERTDLYDRDAGTGAAKRVIDALRAKGAAS